MAKTNGEVTRWTLIRRAQGDDAGARAALGELLARYERTVILQIGSLQRQLRWQAPAHTPEDLKQELMLELIQRGDIHKLDPSRGSFRGWLHVAVRNFTRRRYRTWLATRYGNTLTSVADFEITDAATPELEFTRAYAADLLCAVLARLDAENEGKPRYPHLRRFLPGPQMDPVELKPLAAALGTTVNVLSVANHGLRARYKQMLFDAVADTLELDREPDGSIGAAAAAAVQRELRELYRSLVVDRQPKLGQMEKRG